jgi:hypothetical protein
MQKKSQFSGVIGPVLTPFGEDGGRMPSASWSIASG